MADVRAVIRRLEKERNHLRSQIDRLQEAMTILSAVGSRDRRRGKRHLSPSARRRIAAAQKARWAQWRAKRKR